MTAPMSKLRALAGIVVALVICGCSSVGTELRRVDDIGKLPHDARIGLVEFTQCGAGYLDRLNPDYYWQDAKATFLLTCTEMGYPGTFHDRLLQRLEERLGRKLVRIRSDKPFLAKVVLKDAEKLGLDYVLGGELLAMGETAKEDVISAHLFVARVDDRKVVLKGRVKKTAARGRMQNIIDEVADELFVKAFAE